jgi:RimJ/RimL family protein N-acetyltransferase
MTRQNLLLKYCFEELECQRVEFKTDVLNKPARNALKRIGAVEEGVLKKPYFNDT